ncbi:transcriptional regulator, Crp/Fnr family [Denitrovibrio acetiphilus DSM 12809]|uniref:Transcriptional regulator, Crp/Fnr family n=1 Tax=Denitrovibrio acetiphilus (strain DSM 12809 / NBRC 114555 / N2460) TaxID=522772 RepID=D4H3U3_DENA2|nr:Crp/Fnr family transcriptional regulator [Denitrovibrio acetiphilus]ADD69195.1 transcriptional regulator, Crp/Fnr family [Denitrovibrio acetiphilus DSM 12809]
MFAFLNDQIKELLLSSASEKTFKKYDFLYMQGDDVSKAFVVSEGWVKISRINENGGECVVRVAAANESVGEDEILSAKQYGFTAQVITPALIYQIPKSAYDMAYKIDKEAVKEAIEQDTQYSVTADNDIVTDPYIAMGRLVEFLMSIGDNRSRKEMIVNLPYDKHLVAARLLMTPETLSRCLKKLKDIGVEIKKNTIFVPDIHKLVKIAVR